MREPEFCRFCSHGLTEYSNLPDNEDSKAWGQVALSISMLASSAVVGIFLRQLFPAVNVAGINCLCAGMFLALALCHVLPEAAEGSPNWAYFTAIGYLVVLFVDKVVVPHDHGDDYVNAQPRRATNHSDAERGVLLVPEEVVTSRLSASSHILPHPTTCDSMPSQNASIALVVTLSVHSLFEGLAVGSSNSNMMLLAGVISLHKWAAAFALTSFLTVDTGTLDRCRLLVLATFVVASPVGAMLGVLSKEWKSLEAPVQGAAGGTLLFVAMTEVIPAEFSNLNSGISTRQRFGFLLLGMALIIILLTLFPEDMGHAKSPVADAMHTIAAECAKIC